MEEIELLLQKQFSDHKWFEDFSDIEEWTDSYLELRTPEDGMQWYQRIDHIQIVPASSGVRKVAGYHVFVVYHRVYVCVREDK